MKKRLAIYIVPVMILILYIIIILYLFTLQEIPQPQLSPLEEFNPPILEDCSESEIKTLWDYLFKENSNNLEISYDPEENDCRYFIATKILKDIQSETKVEFVGTGTDAQGNAVIEEGKIKRIEITRGGSGYTTQTQVRFTSTTGTGAQATVILSEGVITEIQITEQGLRYQNAEEVIITGLTGSSSNARGIVTVEEGKVIRISIKNGGSNYAENEEVQLNPVRETDDITIAKGKVTKINNGVITSAQITSEGSGYNTPSNSDEFFILHNILTYQQDYSMHSVSYHVEAIHGNAENSYLDSLRNLRIPTLDEEIVNFGDYVATFYSTFYGIIGMKERNIETNEQANNKFKSIFKIETEPANWRLNTTGSQLYQYYEFNNTRKNNLTIGIVNKKYEQEKLVFVVGRQERTCTPNYREIEGECQQDDTRVITYEDINNCERIYSHPQPKKRDCDYNNLSIVGNNSQINATNIAIQIAISTSPLNTSNDYNETKLVQLKEESIVRVEFNYNFSKEPLNLRNIKIEKQPSSSKFGYLIVENINVAKKIAIDKINSTSSSVCIRDKQTPSITEISTKCEDDDEIELGCPDEDEGYRCEIAESKFIVSGLKSSGVRELFATLSPPSPPGCASSWNCTGWSTCVNSIQTRTCRDLNRCNPINLTKAETQICISSPLTQCIPDWICPENEWTPEECPQNKTQVRKSPCIDANLCNSTRGKPTDTKSCTPEEKSSQNLLLIAIIVLSLFILTVIIIIVYIITKQKNQYISPTIQYQPRPSTQYQFRYNNQEY